MNSAEVTAKIIPFHCYVLCVKTVYLLMKIVQCMMFIMVAIYCSIHVILLYPCIVLYIVLLHRAL